MFFLLSFHGFRRVYFFSWFFAFCKRVVNITQLTDELFKHKTARTRKNRRRLTITFTSNGKREFVPRDYGRDPFNQTFRKFRSKTQWIGSVQPEKFRKNGSTFWGGPLFSVGPVWILVEWIAPYVSSLLFNVFAPKLVVSRNFLFIRIVLSCFYLLIFYFEKSSVNLLPYTWSLIP